MSKTKLILFILIASYTIYFSWTTVSRHYFGFSSRFDLGNMEQTVWNTARGRIFQMTNPDTSEISSRLAFHADFLLILIAPIYLLFPYTETLLIIQALVVALGAIPVYLISKKVLKNNSISLFLSLLYLLNPILERANIFEFHSEVLGVTFLLFAAYYLLFTKNIKYFLIFFALALISKETISFALAALCFIGFIKKRFLRLNIFLLCLCVAYFTVMVGLIIPLVNTTNSAHFAFRHYTNITNHASVFTQLFSQNSLNYLLSLFSTTGFLSLFSPLYLLLCTPTIIINLLSGDPQFRSFNYHYSATIIPGLILSSIYGFKNLSKLIVTLSTKMKVKNILTIKQPARVLFSLLIFIFYLLTIRPLSPLPGLGSHPYLDFQTHHYSSIEKIRYWSAQIAEEKSVSATNNSGAFFAKRQNLYVFPQMIGQADYVVIAFQSWQEILNNQERDKIIGQLIADSHYQLKDQSQDFYLFEKINR